MVGDRVKTVYGYGSIVESNTEMFDKQHKAIFENMKKVKLDNSALLRPDWKWRRT